MVLGRPKSAEQRKPECQKLLEKKSAKSKRGRREGDGKKNVTTICDKRHDVLRQFATFYDNFRLFVPLT